MKTNWACIYKPKRSYKGFADSELLDVQTYMKHFEIYKKISGIK